MAEHAGLSGRDLIELVAGETRALIAPDIGANCVAFEVGGRQIVEPVPSLDALRATPPWYGCPILFPFPGRVREGRYRFDGREYQLTLNAPGEPTTHIHGFAPGARWRVASRDTTSCDCVLDQMMLTPEERAGYPWPFALTVRWTVAPGRLRADARVENSGESDLPFGFGLHPYLTVAPDALLRAPTAARWPIADNMIAGNPEPGPATWRWAELEPGASLLLTDVPPEVAEATAGDTVLRFPGDRFGEVVVWRPFAGRASVCIEPWTSVAGAPNLLEVGAPHGLLRLPPGATWEGWMEIEAREA